MDGPTKFRVTLYSNHDCLNSDWLEQSDGYSYYNSYFGDMVDFLQFNPRELEKQLRAAGISLYESDWPDLKDREPLTDHASFANELINNATGGLFVILGQAYTFDLDNVERVVFEDGAVGGIFNSWRGGGSVIECPIKPGTVIELGRRTGERILDEHPDPDIKYVPEAYTEYDHAEIVLDSVKYSIADVYGFGAFEFAEARLE